MNLGKRLLIGRMVKCAMVVVLGYMIVHKLVDLKMMYVDDMTPYAAELYKSISKFQQQFVALVPDVELDRLVENFGGNYVGSVTSAQLRNKIPSEKYAGVVDLRLVDVIVRKQYVGDFVCHYYTLPYIEDYVGRLLVKCSADGKVKEYKVIYDGKGGE